MLIIIIIDIVIILLIIHLYTFSFQFNKNIYYFFVSCISWLQEVYFRLWFTRSLSDLSTKIYLNYRTLFIRVDRRWFWWEQYPTDWLSAHVSQSYNSYLIRSNPSLPNVHAYHSSFLFFLLSPKFFVSRTQRSYLLLN